MAMKERQLVETKWERVGEVVTGHLVSAQQVKFRDGGTNVNYLVKRSSDGAVVAFPGTSKLNQLLHVSDVGSLVEITFKGTQPPRVEGNSPTKIFRVAVDAESKIPVGNSDPGITDADIPF